ncbi:biotin holocarboxylase synthetase [Knufia obscura]|uniref:Biotin holocarboxylase synthetase n=2 Tax=Knufia TaxID=430999 RepID=A0AAN8ENR4_9EURO|nr:biotin holocarboxylase synthetase [Knufia obscura]KAK5948868.1 biotin holocarboxylase synthetase [Knufia fluminis]
MSSRRMNVLVYSGAIQSHESWWKNENLILLSGNGSTVESVRHCLYTLRRLLSPNYAVIPVTGDMIIKEPWQSTCAALVFPGGADQGYCRTLNGAGNRRIKQYVEQGGKYIGFCAGGYYGTARVEFEVGNRLLEVVGDRELAFYPGTSRGCAFSGFVYHSEKGTRASELSVNKIALASGSIPNVLKSYYNGGGVFVDAPRYAGQGVEILADYNDKLDVDAGEGRAAIVYCKVGEGSALLTGPHPEFVFGFSKPVDNWSLTKPRFASQNLQQPKEDVPGFSKVVEVLAKDEKHRMDFLKACLLKLGLTINEEQNVPSLSHIHLSSIEPSSTKKIVQDLQEITAKDEHDQDVVKDENDTFHIIQPSVYSTNDLQEALPSSQPSTSEAQESHADQTSGSSNAPTNQSSSTASISTPSSSTEAAAEPQILDYNTIPKTIAIHDTTYPSAKETPYFNHSSFYSNLKSYTTAQHLDTPTFATHLLYGEVVTSTNTLLEKNTKLLRRLPHGTTFTATTQLAGRGRGSNVWVSPAGSLMFSVVIRHPMTHLSSAPVVFIQYLAAMAIVSGIKNYDGNTYKSLPVKLKWPNDIYALDPSKANTPGLPENEKYTKIGGILVNSHYNSKEYIAVCGAGINVSNTSPTVSLNDLIPLLPQAYRAAQPFQLEKLLASILVSLESLYQQFMATGFDKVMEDMYYAHWLHMDQIVTIESEGGVRAQIKGITRDYGLLVADELGWEDRPMGKRITLMSDSNSFDFFRGLVKRKV